MDGMVMNCPKCGTTNDESATLCLSCRTSLVAPVQPAHKNKFSNAQIIIVAAVAMFAVFIIAAAI